VAWIGRTAAAATGAATLGATGAAHELVRFEIRRIRG